MSQTRQVSQWWWAGILLGTSVWRHPDRLLMFWAYEDSQIVRLSTCGVGFSAWKRASDILPRLGVFWILRRPSNTAHQSSLTQSPHPPPYRKANPGDGDDPSPAHRRGGTGEAEQHQDVRRAQPPVSPPERHPRLRHVLLRLPPPVPGVQPPRARYALSHRRVPVLAGRNLMAAVVLLQVLYWLSGLSCTDENFIIKSGAQRAAAAHGIALVAPDTSPRMSILKPCCCCVLFLGFVSVCQTMWGITRRLTIFPTNCAWFAPICW
jgi:hypothetical protein